MREMSLEQELVFLRDQVAKIRSAGCPETFRLPERGWLLVHQALIRASGAEDRPDETVGEPILLKPGRSQRA